MFEVHNKTRARCRLLGPAEVFVLILQDPKALISLVQILMEYAV